MNFIENEITELKSELNENIIKEVIAFANTKGGIIYLGVNDDGTILGIADTKLTIEKLSSMISDSIYPDITYMISFDTMKEQEKDIILIKVIRGTNVPYYIKSKGLTDKGVYMRVGNTSRPANQMAIKNMILQSENVTFETNLSNNPNLHFNYLEELLVSNYMQLTENLKRKFGIINANNEYTNLGLILSDECPHTIKVAVYKDNTYNSFIDRKEFVGSVIRQIDLVMEYLNLNNKIAGDIIGTDRVSY